MMSSRWMRIDGASRVCFARCGHRTNGRTLGSACSAKRAQDARITRTSFRLSQMHQRMHFGSVAQDTWSGLSWGSPTPCPPSSPRPALFRICRAAWRTSLRVRRLFYCTSRVAGRPTSIPGDLAVCTARVALKSVHVQQLRVAATQVDAWHWIALYYLRPLGLSLLISHSSLLLPLTSLHTIGLLVSVRFAIDHTSLSKAPALASDHATVCCFGRPRNSNVPISLQGPRRP